MIENLEVEFKSDINNRNLRDRKYTLTHSDETGQRYLFIGDKFAEDKYSKLRDEVVGQWSKKHARCELRIMCTLNSEQSLYSEEKRYEIFKRHMPRAIIAIVNGDKEYIKDNSLLDYDVYVYYLSNTMPKMEHYGKVSDYIKAYRNSPFLEKQELPIKRRIN